MGIKKKVHQSGKLFFRFISRRSRKSEAVKATKNYKKQGIVTYYRVVKDGKWWNIYGWGGRKK